MTTPDETTTTAGPAVDDEIDAVETARFPAVDEATYARWLAQELTALDDARAPVRLSLSLSPFDAFTLVAALQLASRHPDLSEIQLNSILRAAHEIADLLTAATRGRFGPASVTEQLLRAGFDVSRDVPTPTSGG